VHTETQGLCLHLHLIERKGGQYMATDDLGLNDWDPIRGYVHGILCQNHDDWHYERISFYVRKPHTLIGQYAVQVLGQIGDRRGWAAIAEVLPKLGPNDRTIGCEFMPAGRPLEEVYLKALAGIDPSAARAILQSYLQDSSKVYLHESVVALLSMLEPAR